MSNGVVVIPNGNGASVVISGLAGGTPVDYGVVSGIVSGMISGISGSGASYPDIYNISGKIGFFTNTPEYPVDVVVSDSAFGFRITDVSFDPYFIVKGNGSRANIGINVANPQYDLDVDTIGHNGSVITFDDLSWDGTNAVSIYSSDSVVLQCGRDVGNGNILLNPTLFGSRVGICTGLPRYTLDVNGSGNFSNGIYINGNPVITGTQSSFITTSQTGQFSPLLLTVLTTGNQNVSGIKTFIGGTGTVNISTSRTDFVGTGLIGALRFASTFYNSPLGGISLIAETGFSGGSYPSALTFYTSKNGLPYYEIARFNNSGFFGILNNNPQYHLDVSGTGNFRSALLVNGTSVLTQQNTGNFYPMSGNPSGFLTGASGANGQIQINGNGRPSGDSRLTWNSSLGALQTKYLYLPSDNGGPYTGKIYSTFGGGSYVTSINVGTNYNLSIQPPISLSNGIAFASVNDASTANMGMEFRASEYKFWNSPVTIDSTLQANHIINVNGDYFDNYLNFYFNIGTNWGVFDSSSNPLFIVNNDGNNSCGIGTLTPSAKLHIETASPGGSISNDGNARLLFNVDYNNNPNIELHRGINGYNQAGAMYWDWVWDDYADYNARIIMSDRDVLNWGGNVQYLFDSDTSSNTNSNQATLTTRNLAVSASSNYRNQSLTTGWVIIEGNLGVGTLTPSYKIDVSGSVNVTGSYYLNTKVVEPKLTTSTGTAGTVTMNTGYLQETLYLSSSSTILSITVALPSSSTTIGQIYRIHSKSAVTTLSVTAGSLADAAVTTLTAGQTIGYQAFNTSGGFIRIQ